jgi:hypothetical protein
MQESHASRDHLNAVAVQSWQAFRPDLILNRTSLSFERPLSMLCDILRVSLRKYRIVLPILS